MIYSVKVIVKLFYKLPALVVGRILQHWKSGSISSRRSLNQNSGDGHCRHLLLRCRVSDQWEPNRGLLQLFLWKVNRIFI